MMFGRSAARETIAPKRTRMKATNRMKPEHSNGGRHRQTETGVANRARLPSVRMDMKTLSVVVGSAVLVSIAEAALRHESFDREPPNWEGVNNRSTAFEPKKVVQDF